MQGSYVPLKAHYDDSEGGRMWMQVCTCYRCGAEYTPCVCTEHSSGMAFRHTAICVACITELAAVSQTLWDKDLAESIAREPERQARRAAAFAARNE